MKQMLTKDLIDSLYLYRAVCTSVYDGDTVTLDIDLGFGHWIKGRKCRLFGINTPELRGDDKESGIAARNRLRQLINNQPVLIKSIKDKSGKFGRLLVEIYCHGANVNQQLINERHAVQYKP